LTLYNTTFKKPVVKKPMGLKKEIIFPSIFDESGFTQQFLSFMHYSNISYNKLGSYLGLSEDITSTSKCRDREKPQIPTT
jgi:hypothetical protein